MTRIQSKKHKIEKYKINKNSLSCFDDKKFVLDDGIHTLAYFHKALQKQILIYYHKEEEIQKDSHKKRRFSQMITNTNNCIQISQAVGRLREYTSVVQYMRLSGQFQASLIFFFYQKILNAQKRKSNLNQLAKQKQANKKQQRQRFFGHKNI